ncbi:MAG TPA: hypothetical protein VFF69_13805 [Phycisphaerales bacterium]|nr:hypothetical protein [Phycisphaerales bacterium]
MRRGAFTLLEIMIVVALVVAISAVALPSLASRVAGAQIGHAERSLHAAAALVQAEAMARGAPVSLVAERVGDEWALYAEPGGESGPPSDPGDAPAPPAEGLSSRIELARFGEVQLSGALPEADEASPDAPPVETPDALTEPRLPLNVGDEAPGPERHEIAVFFPDGGCRPARPTYIVSGQGDRRAVYLRPLTGRVDVRRLPSVSEGFAQRGDADPADSLLPYGTEDDR